MGIYDNSVMKSVSRRSMTIFFIVDTSGSMTGRKIGALNLAVEETLPELKSISAGNADALIKIAVLRFSCGAEWITPNPVEVEAYSWNSLNADGMTDFGDACFKLEQKLHKEAFMADNAGCYAPVFILLSDGEPTDDYVKSLGNLKANNWFKKGIRVAIAIGDGANTQMLTEFTGNPETVFTVYTPETLRKIIRFVSVTASQVASKSMCVGTSAPDQTTSKQDEFIASVQADPMGLQPADDGSDLGDIDWC